MDSLTRSKEYKRIEGEKKQDSNLRGSEVRISRTNLQIKEHCSDLLQPACYATTCRYPTMSLRVPQPDDPPTRPPNRRWNSMTRQHEYGTLSPSPTFPSYYSSRKKPRRWPLVIRFIKGAIHKDIALPVVLHALFATLIAYLDMRRENHLGVPSSTIPSLSIVVGLMLVFRNQTSYDRFWEGQKYLTTVQTNMRNLTRSFLTCSCLLSDRASPTDAERADTERTVRILLAMLYATKNHLRAEWGSELPISLMLQPLEQIERARRESMSTAKPEYQDLLPASTKNFEEQGLSLVLQLSIQIEGYIKRGVERGWFHAPQASQMTVQLNDLVSAYGCMETIHLTPLPVAYLIHMRQVLALFCCIVPFALVEEIGWWSIGMTAIISFTLYGIEGISRQLEVRKRAFQFARNLLKHRTYCSDHRIRSAMTETTSKSMRSWRI